MKKATAPKVVRRRKVNDDPVPDKKPPTVVFNSFAETVPEEIAENQDRIIMHLSVPMIDKDVECNKGEPTGFNISTYENMADIEKNCEDAIETHTSEKLKIVNLLKEFQQKGKNGDGWPASTHIFCYHCCHPFENAPFGLPIKYVDDKFHVSGCFCSLECTMAYNIDSKSSMDEVLERKNMIHMISHQTGHTNRVKAAPNKLALKCYGGHMTIEEFRVYHKTTKIINVNLPPMITMTQQIEEINENDINRDFKYVPIDVERIEKYKEKIKIKRSKPIIDHTKTLDYSMKLTFN